MPEKCFTPSFLKKLSRDVVSEWIVNSNSNLRRCLCTDPSKYSICAKASSKIALCCLTMKTDYVFQILLCTNQFLLSFALHINIVRNSTTLKFMFIVSAVFSVSKLFTDSKKRAIDSCNISPAMFYFLHTFSYTSHRSYL